MERALGQAGLAPDAVDHINAHGTGTKHNDIAESKAIERLFGTEIPVTSTKSYTGHTLGACGGTEAIFAMWAIERGWIPANLDLEPRDPEAHVHLPTQPAEKRCRHVISYAFAFGGNNCSVLFGGSQ
jgi:3-oxoacyl-(acyl-carrier-protein) synthase